ncbi:hypothetical protein QWI29_22635 [Mycolicibacterium neoaurum]|uniref:hypothetical protein n=1 Tax=Mycolicibacterium neoaurum TaxID=1795 RepID=UPI002673CEA8|nr:hypothetical protein [Mycolicibacterium neoaurum]MDO3402846.1 hypothetical protein [Mycolicibacterium neoaurum]
MINKPSKLLASFAMLTVTALTIGCQREAPEVPESPPAGWPTALNDLTIAWTAEPGIDLLRGSAVAVRAYVESYYLAALTKDQKYLYPGFVQSVDANNSGGPAGTKELWPSTSRPRVWVGTVRHHLLRIDQSGDDKEAVGCAYLYGSATVDDGDYQANVSGTGPGAGVRPFRLVLKSPENEQDLPPQHGPARAPSANVFGGWRITNFQGDYFALAEWPDASTDQSQCEQLADRPPAERDFKPGNSYMRSDFPTQPASPGWPDASTSQ